MRPTHTLIAFALLLVAGCGDDTAPPHADVSADALAPVELEPAPEIDPRAAEPTAPDLVGNDTDYLARLDLIRGHLLVGTTLYRDGNAAHAKRHMKHPADELYTGLEQAFLKREVDGFADELEALASAVASGAPVDTVDAAYAELRDAIDAAARGLRDAPDAALHRRVVARLIGHAADEYAIGVADDGAVVEPHEYQDAWGFTQVAMERAESARAAGDDVEWAPVIAALQGLEPLWPALDAETVSADGPATIAAVSATLQPAG